VLLTLLVGLMPMSHALRSQQVGSLNRVTFTGNVLANNEGDGPEGWVVWFCAEWYEPCQALNKDFAAAALEHGGISENNLFTRTTRFAAVDCAVDKVLCNSQDVDSYPTIVHYRHGGRAGEWSFSGGADDKESKKLTKWMDKQMDNLSPPAVGADGVQKSHEVGTGVAEFIRQQFRPSDSAGQMIPMIVLLFAGAMSVCRLGSEVRQGIQLLQEVSRAPHRKEKQEKQVSPDIPQEERAGLVRSLPEAWARERSSIEL